MTKRSKVELFEQIRRTRRFEPDVSVRELARRFETHRRTVREALASAVPAPRKLADRTSPVLEPWKSTIDGWLIADRDAPRKQRHTARRVWQRLVDEHDAVVGESTVRRYVAEAKRALPPVIAKVMVPQSHPLGAEAEVDFGQVSFVLDGLDQQRDAGQCAHWERRRRVQAHALERVKGRESSADTTDLDQLMRRTW